MTITIPEWLLWTLSAVFGIPVLFGLLILAWIGWVALTCFGRQGK